MTSHDLSILEAYAAFGLAPDAGVRAAKSAFRERVKMLHPDVTPASTESLFELSRIVAAIEVIRAAGPISLELSLSADEARTGVTRTLRCDGRPIIVRVPAGTPTGTCLPAVGETRPCVLVRVDAAPQQADLPAASPHFRDELDGFIDEFSRTSAHARFARWIRNAQPAA
ncbi:J domain-containing protein [Maricaulis sp. CAU 1757]